MQKLKSFEEAGGILHGQVHDSIIAAVPRDNVQLVDKLLTIMEEPVTIKGRTFKVPATAVIGLRWGDSMVPYKQGITRAEIEQTTIAS